MPETPVHPYPERLWNKASRDESGCLVWHPESATDKDGYGRIRIAGVRHRSHRVALATFLGRPIPEEILVLHTCDNPPCIEPEHLYEGDNEDNSRDMAERVRCAFQKSRKLTPEQVRAIRSSELSHTALAASLGVSKHIIKRARDGITYKEVV